jgi:hypothetical protein
MIDTNLKGRIGKKKKIEIGSSEANESMLYRESGLEDVIVHHLQGVIIHLNAVVRGIIAVISTGVGWPTTAVD